MAASQRSDTGLAVIARLRPQLARVPGIEVYMQNPPTVRIGGQVSKSLYQYSIFLPFLRHGVRDLGSALSKQWHAVFP